MFISVFRVGNENNLKQTLISVPSYHEDRFWTVSSFWFQHENCVEIGPITKEMFANRHFDKLSNHLDNSIR